MNPDEVKQGLSTFSSYTSDLDMDTEQTGGGPFDNHLKSIVSSVRRKFSNIFQLVYVDPPEIWAESWFYIILVIEALTMTRNVWRSLSGALVSAIQLSRLWLLFQILLPKAFMACHYM